MAITYKVLGQIIPAAGATSTLYTVPAYVSTVVSTVAICNQSNTATTFTLAVRPLGAVIDPKHYLNYNTTVAANSTIPLTIGMTLGTTDIITASSASGNVSFVAFGAENGTIPSNVPNITGFAITDSSYNTLAQTAINTTGGYIKLSGSGFAAGCTVYINGVAAISTTVISSIQVNAQLPALSAGAYSVTLFNTNALGAIYANGIVYSSVPTWTTSSYSSTTTINVQLLATGDAPLTYTLASGSLPSGVTLSSTGLLSGTATQNSYSFSVTATDPQLQSSTQLISLNIITSILIETLVVAGGGAGVGAASGNAVPAGGAGAGGVVYHPSYTVGGTYTITVGGGGAKTAFGALASAVGGSGNDSIFGSNIIVAKGGGGGGAYTTGANGGSGGGGGLSVLAGGTSTQSTLGVNPIGSTYYGTAGGAGPTLLQGSGGGGGAALAGAPASSTNGIPCGAGTGNYTSLLAMAGAGVLSVSTYYIAGGGGGGGYYNGAATAGAGGVGGGGAGGNNASNASPGATNTGGGGGSAPSTYLGGDGGSGIVIIRYADTYPAAALTTGSPTITVSGGYRVYKFTTSGTITF